MKEGPYLICAISHQVFVRKIGYWAVYLIFNYNSFVNLLLHLNLCGDGVNICKKLLVKLRKTRSLVIHLLISYQLNDHQENYGNQRLKIQVIRDSSLCKKNFVARMLHEVCQSHDQKLYFTNSKFKPNVDCNLVEVGEKPFEAPKFILKSD